ncbi:MAG: cohesin domain-containing protein [Candidatus Bathyarchaeia archaeon]
MRKALATILVALMLMAALPPFLLKPAYAPVENSMWIEPASIDFGTDTKSPGDRFNVSIKLWVTAEPMFAWQFRLSFNPTQISAKRAGYKPGPNSEWASYRTGGAVATVVPEIGTNYVLLTESLVGDNYVPNTTPEVYLAWVEFEIVAAPPMGGELNSVLSIDHAQTWVERYPDLEEISIQKIGATYRYYWVAPPRPRLAVDPSYREYGPYPPSAVGTEFDENILIKGLSAAWFLKNASTWLAYDPDLLVVVGVTFGTAWTYTEFDNSTAGDLYLFANTTTPPSGDVLLATVRFKIIFQDTAPPRLPGEYDESPLDLHDYHLFAEPIEIQTMPEIDGKVRIYCLITLPVPYLEVSSHIMSVCAEGDEFNVTVSLKNLDSHWYLVAIQFRLRYPADLIEPVECYEGPFLPSFAALQPGSLGTFYVSYFEDWPPYGPHVLYGELIFPNATGWWHEPFPEGSGVVAIITFKVKYVPWPDEGSITAPLEIVWQGAVGLDGPETQNIVDVPLADPVDGTYTITPYFAGRRIDLYGGAVNSGYGTAYGIEYGPGFFWPAPYGGQGPNKPMDLVIDQSLVWLFANVTYHGWPVQTKRVNFEVLMPDGTTYTKLSAVTDSNGVAYVSFRMPWPCDNPEGLFGKWKVIATCSLADEVINDTMEFHYDYLVHIWKVTTNKYYYNHKEKVIITIEYGSHAMQTYPVLFTAIIQDELGVTIGLATINTTVGGAKFCTYKNDIQTLSIEIPKWAFAGIAKVRVNAFDKEPAEGGFNWCPEATTKICILPA